MKKNSLKNFLLDADVRQKSAQTENSSLRTKNFALLCIDYGEKYCGIAWSPDGIISLPVEIIDTQGAEKKIRELITDKKIKQLVFGLPLAPDGGENHICQMIKKFAQKFNSQSLKLVFVNERGSSQSTLRSKNLRIDDQAAVNILQYYLESSPNTI